MSEKKHGEEVEDVCFCMYMRGTCVFEQLRVVYTQQKKGQKACVFSCVVAW